MKLSVGALDLRLESSHLPLTVSRVGLWGTAVTGAGFLKLIEIALGGWLAALAAIVAIQLLRGMIATAGLLSARNGRGIAVTRVQLMITTVTFAVGYLGAALAQRAGAGLPDIPSPMIAALFGSHGFYLGGKYQAQRS